MDDCQPEDIKTIYEQHCAANFDSQEKYIIFILRIIVMMISILSSLFVITIILKSKKKQFWPFKVIFCQVLSELIDLTLALIFTVNSSCWPEACKVVGYIMHSNWLASLNFMCFQCFLFLCLIRFEFLFNLIMRYLYIILFLLYAAPYAMLSYVLFKNGFGPSGWYLQNGEFYFIFCGFNNELLYYFFGLPVSILFFISILISSFNACFWIRLSYKRELRYPALRIKAMITFPLFYFIAWVVNFLIRIPDTQSVQQDYCPKEEQNIYLYIFYEFLNLGFELHLTVGAVMFYQIFKGLFRFDSVWKELFGQEKKNSNQEKQKALLSKTNSTIQLE